jgi:hypothetical protein
VRAGQRLASKTIAFAFAALRRRVAPIAVPPPVNDFDELRIPTVQIAAVERKGIACWKLPDRQLRFDLVEPIFERGEVRAITTLVQAASRR